MTKLKNWILPLIIVVGLVLYFIFNPINIQIGDTVIFATYRTNPQTAYYDNQINIAVEGGPIDIVSDIDVVDVTDNYSIYISLSESEMYDNCVMFCLMKRNDSDKYYFMGEIDRVNLNYDITYSPSSFDTKHGKIQFSLISISDFESNEDFYKQEYNCNFLVFEDVNKVKYNVVFLSRAVE